MLNSFNHKGQSVIEFAFLIVLIAIVLLLGLSLFGVSISDSYSAIISKFP